MDDQAHKHEYIMGYDGKLFCSDCKKEWYPTDVAEDRDEFREQRDALRARVAELEAGLRWYADAANYEQHYDARQDDYLDSDVVNDEGERARKLLGED